MAWPRAVLERHSFTFWRILQTKFLTDAISSKDCGYDWNWWCVNVIEIGPGIDWCLDGVSFEHWIWLWDWPPFGANLADTLRDFDKCDWLSEDILKVDLTTYQNFKNPNLQSICLTTSTPIHTRLRVAFLLVSCGHDAERSSGRISANLTPKLTVACLSPLLLHDMGCLYRASCSALLQQMWTAIAKMVRRPEPAVAVEDENFFFGFPKAGLSIAVRPCGITLW